MKEQATNPHMTSQTASSARKSRTPLGAGGRLNRASSRLPEKSGLRRAMQGYGGGGGSDPSSSSSSPSDRSGDGSSSGDDIFRHEPESDHSSDSEGTKRRKREKRRRHRAKLNALKYHQSFLKNEPPFKYGGEVQASTFKKWCQEVRDWIKDGCLGHRRGIRQSGKYLTGRAYKFFEQDILQKGIKYTLTDYFAALFDYIFPADFRMQQRDKFDVYYQGNLSVVDFLRRLQDLADTVGDLDDADVVLAFWRRCKPYLKAELTRAGYEPSELTSSELEVLATRIERADEAAHETRKGTSSKLSQSRGEPKRHSHGANAPQPAKSKSNSGSNVDLGSHSTNSTNSSHRPVSKPNNFKRPRRDHPDHDKERQRIKRLWEEGRCFHCESPDHMAKDCPQRHNKKPPMRLNSVAMSATEIKLAALSEGREMGLFTLGNETHLIEYQSAERSLEFQLALRDVLWAHVLAQLYDNVPLAFDLLEGYRTDPFSPNRFSLIEYGGFDTYLLTDDHTLVTYILTREQLIDPGFDLIHWFHIQQSENFHDMRRAPWWDTEGGPNHSTFQEDWQAYLEEHSGCSSDEEDAVIDSVAFEMHDLEDEFVDMPDLETIYDTDEVNDDRPQAVNDFPDYIPYNWMRSHPDDDDNASGGSSLPVEEVLDPSEGEISKQHLKRQPMPFVK